MTDTATPTNGPTNLTGNTASEPKEQIQLVQNGRKVELNAPEQSGQQAVVKANGVDQIVANFDPQTADVAIRDGDLVFTFENGSTTVIEEFELAQPMPEIMLQDGTVIAGDVIVAQLIGQDTENLTDIETAAGEGVQSGGGSSYSDNFGNVIGLLEANGPIGFGAFGGASAFERDTFQDDLLIGTLVDPSEPSAGDSGTAIDETDGFSNTVAGDLIFDFGPDGPGDVAGNGSFSSAGSLTSDGQPISVSFDPATNTYTGSLPNGTTIFTLVLDPQTNEYVFTLNGPIDHPDSTDPDDALDLFFGFTVTDSDGDSEAATITITVNDDGPVATDDSASVAQGTNSVSGDVLSNDSFGEDGPLDGTSTVTSISVAGGAAQTIPDGGSISIDGQYGTLTINSDGTYTYVAFNGVTGNNLVDQFEYLIIDNDLDEDTAILTINVAPDGTPMIDPNPQGQGILTSDETDDIGSTLTGQMNIDYGADGQGATGGVDGTGAFTSSVPLTSGGQTVIVTYNPATGVYTGTILGTTTDVFTLLINDDGSYEFTLLGVLDHPDATDPDDTIELGFGVEITDADGDTANGILQINVDDDGPSAVSDIDTLATGQTSTDGNVITGAGTDNNGTDDFGEDGGGRLVSIAFGDPLTTTQVTTPVPEGGSVTINGQYGTLTIHSDGSYTYQLNDGVTGTDLSEVFTYTIIDGDNDEAIATLTIDIDDIVDGVPTIGDASDSIDESFQLGVPDSSTFTVDFGPDGPGEVGGNGVFSSSVPLTSGGEPVTVSLVNGDYVGTLADGTIVFELVIDENNPGSFFYLQHLPLDHPDRNDPDDRIDLEFGIVVSDSDGDTASGTITIGVDDDGPVATDDLVVFNQNTGVADGNVLDNDDFGVDGSFFGQNGQESVSAVRFGDGIFELIPEGGSISVDGEYGTLTINSDGSYTYTLFDGVTGDDLVDQFEYIINDGDLDADTAVLTIDIGDIDVNGMPTIENVVDGVDETSQIGVAETGSINVDFGSDGAGSVGANGTFTSSVALSSGGQAISVSLVNGNYVGTLADGTVAFELVLNTSVTPPTYAFTQFLPLDHPDATDPDDVISLEFGVQVSDSDGDTDTGTITINVDDDGPVTEASFLDFDESTNISSPGNIQILEGAVDFDYGVDGAGSLLAGDSNGLPVFTVGGVSQLTSNGVPLEIFLFGGNTYRAVMPNGRKVFDLTINPDGTYSFFMNAPLDHPDGMDPNDLITLNFGYTVTDSEGDSVAGTVTINVFDDGPVAVNDTESLQEGETVVSGNVAENDDFGSDFGGRLISAGFNGETTSVPQSGSVAISGQFGVLTINADGSYTYQLNAGVTGNDIVDVFTYTIVDGDGDTSTATLTIDAEGNVVIEPPPSDSVVVDETDDLGVSVSGDVMFDGGSNFSGNGEFEIVSNLTHIVSGTRGIVSVSESNGVYTGTTSDGTVIFTLTINADGSYDFVQFQALSHPDSDDPNDAIVLSFGYDASVGGSSVDGTINVTILDDGPVANPDSHVLEPGDKTLTGNVVTGEGTTSGAAGADDFGADGAHSFIVTNVRFAGVDYPITSTQQFTTIVIGFGSSRVEVTFRADGSYVYQQWFDRPPGSTLTFQYTVQDRDGDESTSVVQFITPPDNSAPEVVENDLDSLPPEAALLSTTGDSDTVTVIDGGGEPNLDLPDGLIDIMPFDTPEDGDVLPDEVAATSSVEVIDGGGEPNTDLPDGLINIMPFDTPQDVALSPDDLLTTQPADSVTIDSDQIGELTYDYEMGDAIDISELIDVDAFVELGAPVESFLSYDRDAGVLLVDSTGQGDFGENSQELSVGGYDGGKLKIAVEDMVIDTEFNT